MHFADVLNREDPAYLIFQAALDAVFDEDDGVNEHIDRLSKEGRTVYLLCCFDGEIHNGGFDQLFTNSLGNHCLEILQYLENVGAVKAHALLSKAISWFPNSSPAKNRRERWDQYQLFFENPEYGADIDRLDNEFYKYEDNLSSLINSYVMRHSNAALLA